MANTIAYRHRDRLALDPAHAKTHGRGMRARYVQKERVREYIDRLVLENSVGD
jgi:hypothetical protein